MDKTVTVTTTTTTKIYINTIELEALVLAHLRADGGLTDKYVDVSWDEHSQGGIRGLLLVQVSEVKSDGQRS